MLKSITILSTIAIIFGETCTEIKSYYQESKCCENINSPYMGKSYVKSCVAFAGPVTDMSFNYMANEGLKTSQKLMRVDVQSYTAESSMTGLLGGPVMDEAVKDGCELVIGIGFQYDNSIKTAISLHPSTKFAIVDMVTQGAQSIVFDEKAGAFMVGVIAAMKTQTKKVGFIGGVPIPIIQTFKSGFEQGVKYVDPNIKVESVFVANDMSGFGSPGVAKTIATTQISNDVDVIFHAAGGSGNGMFQAVAEQSTSARKLWGIGVDSDQALQVSDEIKPHILTSMVKRIDEGVIQATLSAAKGSFSPGILKLDLSSGGTSYSTTGSHFDDYKDRVEAIKQMVIGGMITLT